MKQGAEIWKKDEYSILHNFLLALGWLITTALSMMLLLAFGLAFELGGVKKVQGNPAEEVSESVSPRVLCGPPPDWTASGISKHQRWGRSVGCGVENLSCLGIPAHEEFSLSGGGKGADSVLFRIL